MSFVYVSSPGVPGPLSGSSEQSPEEQATPVPPAAPADADGPVVEKLPVSEKQPTSDDLPVADLPADEDLSAESESAPGTRHRRGVNGTPVLVSDLLPLSVLSSGRSGRRRAEDRAADSDPIDNLPLDDHPSGDRADQPSVAETHTAVGGPVGENGPAMDGPAMDGPAMDGPAMDGPAADGTAQDGRSAGHPLTGPMLSLTPLDRTSLSEPTVLDTGVNGSAAPDDLGGTSHVSREFPVVGPPPAPTPRALEWGSNGSASKAAEAAEVGMGDLLAEALAAFQESGHSLSAGTDTSSAHSFDVPGLGTRGQRRNWTLGGQLATDPVDRRSSSAADALTDPELRLPDLTAEPLWQPPGTGRRSTAGD